MTAEESGNAIGQIGLTQVACREVDRHAEVEALVVGDPADDSTDVSALIDAGETERVTAWIEEAEAGGASARAASAGAPSVRPPFRACDTTSCSRPRICCR